MKRCYRKKFAQLFGILEKPYWMLYGIHELHCSISIYKKKPLASILKWLVALKSRPSKNKIFIWRFILTTHSIIYHYQKAKKIFFFVVQKSLSIEKHLRVFINRVAFRFHSDRVLFRFLIDRIFFRTFCDRAIFESSVLGSSSVSALLDSSVGSSALFFHHAAIFLSNRAATFFHQKQMFCFTLYSQRELRTQQNW